jgi:copper chaperone CopZ
MTTVTYNIPNINCQHCVHTIKTEVSEIQGVSAVSADPNSKQASITFEAPATEAKIKEVLAEINYPVAN